jgi:uncharacterized protein YbjT (DUF2867 family)
MKILVYGATGSQQGSVIGSLLSRGHEVRAITHHASKLEQLKGTGADSFLADMGNYDQLVEAHHGIEGVSLLIPFFLKNPSDGWAFAKNAIDAAVQANVKFLVWNSSAFIAPMRTGNPATDLRFDILQYLRKSALPHVVIQPSIYLENLLSPWASQLVAKDNKVPYPTPENMPIGWIASKDVAEFVAEAFDRPHLNSSTFQVSGIENLRGQDLARKFSIGLKRTTEFYPMPPSEFGRKLDALYGEGTGKGAEMVYQKFADTGNYPQLHVEMEPVLEKLPIKMTAIEDWVSAHRTKFTANDLSFASL